MQLNEITYGDQPPIDAYGPGFFRVNEQVYQGGILILPNQGVQAWTGWDDLTALVDAVDSFDVVFLGMGAEIAPIPDAARSVFEAASIPTEVMNSPSAARTYNVLLSEGRRVAVAVLPV